MESLEKITHLFAMFPGIGKKSAARMTFHLLKCDEAFNRELGCSIAELKSKIKSCTLCGSYSEEDLCTICSSPERNRSTICIVEQPQDITTIESTGEYKGVYYVLHGTLSPLDGVGPEELSLGKLINRIKTEKMTEVIIATNPTVEGDSTALYIVHLLKGSGVKVTRIASGLPVGGDFEYADKLSIARSLRSRVPVPETESL